MYLPSGCASLSWCWETLREQAVLPVHPRIEAQRGRDEGVHPAVAGDVPPDGSRPVRDSVGEAPLRRSSAAGATTRRNRRRGRNAGRGCGPSRRDGPGGRPSASSMASASGRARRRRTMVRSWRVIRPLVEQTPEGEVGAVLGPGRADRAGVAADALPAAPVGARVLGDGVSPVGDAGFFRPFPGEPEVVGGRQRLHRIAAGPRVVFGRAGFAGDAEPLLGLVVERVEVVVGNGPVTADPEEAAEAEVFRGVAGRGASPVHGEPTHRHGTRLDVRTVVPGNVVAAIGVFAVVEEAPPRG